MIFIGLSRALRTLEDVTAKRRREGSLMSAVVILLLAVSSPAQEAARPDGFLRVQWHVVELPEPIHIRLEGYVYNTLPWRITNVRLLVDSIDSNRMLIASASGWVAGDVAAGGRGYVYVPVSAHVPTYRPTVQRFDKVILDAPQAP